MLVVGLQKAGDTGGGGLPDPDSQGVHHSFKMDDACMLHMRLILSMRKEGSVYLWRGGGACWWRYCFCIVCSQSPAHHHGRSASGVSGRGCQYVACLPQ
jgi:hypothetical protein